MVKSKIGIGKHESLSKGKSREKDMSKNYSEDSMELESGEVSYKDAKSTSRNSLKLSNNKKVAKENDNTSNYKRSALSDDSSVSSNDSGCGVCGFDDDHANLLLCEGCDTEIHTYCLNPPLEKVPEGDWFCDTCKARMAKAEIDIEKLIRRVPPEMKKRFGEICFAKSAENAHWWPALIFDPRSFLHNDEVVKLAHKNLGKRYLVFFFENQDAFAAIPKTWIIPWETGVKKEFDKGKSVRHASKARKQQFERAMDLANEAFADVAAGVYSDSETEFDSQLDNRSDGFSQKNGQDIISSAPREIQGESTIFDLDPSFDWRSVRDEVLREINTASPSQYPAETSDITRSLTIKQGKILAQPYFGKRILYLGIFTDRGKAVFAIQLFLSKMKRALRTLKNDDDTLDPRSVSNDVSERNKTSTTPTSGDADRLPFSNKSSRNEPSLKTVDIPSFGTFTDKKPVRSRLRSVAKPAPKTSLNTEIIHSLQPQKKAEVEKEKEEKPKPQEQISTRVQDQERNELLLNTSFCHYYLLPLSEL
mmetsp:Transcript_22941/g.48531  ORF Transcript_22941/g.48531 Transcript_22941/m.48531 type:complete len:534 (+) Transcript_22941:3-1604(+)